MAWTPPDGPRPNRGDLDQVADLLRRRRFAVLTGAGISTDSGIPDYRGPDSPPRTPMTFQQFTGDDAFRRHYWARNHVGWRFVHSTTPNAGHRALAAMEASGIVTGVVTQNVDLLHQEAGSRRVIDLHGRYDRVVCLRCGRVVTRQEMAAALDALNPGFVESVGAIEDVEIAPDADAVITQTQHFRVADCWQPDPNGGPGPCGGMLKPEIVYFGETVPAARVAEVLALLDEAEALLVAGSSLTVQSGLRFVRHMSAAAKPIAILNRGATRGDPMATLTWDAGISEGLAGLAWLLEPGQSGPHTD